VFLFNNQGDARTFPWQRQADQREKACNINGAMPLRIEAPNQLGFFSAKTINRKRGVDSRGLIG